MRLIHVDDRGELVCRNFHSGSLPPYGIFSHTWGPEEVTLYDLLNSTSKSKSGYTKLRFGAQRAAYDGLQYFWFDSCCIDKSNSQELTEAINSLFSWFRHAAKCYVYLSDVSTTANGMSAELQQNSWETDFRMSRWFTRGWTLQELLAPERVEFYSSRGQLLGTKHSLGEVIHEITGIPLPALQGRPLDTFSVAERMSWAARRQTSRIEDRAYCLMGLFGVCMPLLYGEGDLAFQRLQKEIMSLTYQTSGLRLLNVNSRPLTIETFANRDEPDYAILSHTCGTNEVSFQDVLLGKAPSRDGYYKIDNCCRLAARQGFNYLWVDTCCIDKSSSAELQEAICSMFKWYKTAKVCYVYLEEYDLQSSSVQLQSCRWFKRGWTLQELIAPTCVEFYDSKWNACGTKTSLCQQIAGITGIDPLILNGADPTRRTVAEKMSWASERSTSRIEDTAYSLMGLFNVFMLMLYGEGERAFIRLQEEIMKRSEDYTIFAWETTEPQSEQCGLFAKSPSEFGRWTRPEGKIRERLPLISQYRSLECLFHDPASMTSRGLLIALPLLKQDMLRFEASQNQRRLRGRDKWLMALRCFFESGHRSNLGAGTYLAMVCHIGSRVMKNNQILCIWLRKHPASGIFTRTSPGAVIMLPGKCADAFRRQSIYTLPSGAVGDWDAF